MSQAKPNIKSFIRTGQFSRRFNLNSRQNAGDAVLSTISSVGSEEDDACMTDIEELGDERQGQKTGTRNQERLTVPAPDSAEERPTSTKSILSAVPSILSSISGGRRSTASRSSRDSSVSRISAVSSNGPLPTITEVPPPLPDGIPQEASPPYTAPHTPPNQQAFPVIPPPPNFEPISMPGDTRSLGSTLAATPPPPSVTPSDTPPNPKKAAPYLAKYHPMPELIEKAPLPGDGPPPSSSGKSTAYTLPRYTPRTSQHTYGSNGSTDPQSRFSWHLSNTQKAKGFYTKWFIDWWLFEIVCWIISAVLMAVILSVLAHYNGKPIPHWHVGMTLNAFISVLSGFSRAALLLPVAEALGQLKWNWFTKKPRRMYDFEILDSASRGPWGSFVLLARSKGITLASIGAAVILLTLPLDLFFQQIVAYPTVWVQTNQTANLPRATFYSNTGLTDDFSAASLYWTDWSLYATVNSYLQKTPLPVDVPKSCPTSNCTWPQYDTLGFCNACSEVSSTITHGCFNSTADWIPFVVPWGVNMNATYITACGYFFNPPGLNQLPILLSGYELLPDNTPGAILVARHVPLTDPRYENQIVPGGTINFKNIQNPLFDLIISNNPNGKNGALDDVAPTVMECSLSWCVKTLQTTYAYGNYSEDVIGISQLNTNDVAHPWVGVVPDLSYLPQYSLTRQDAYGTGGQTTYGADNVTTFSIMGGLQDFELESWGILNNGTEQQLEVKLAWQYGWEKVLPLQFAVDQTVWDGANITEKMDDLANSMTNVIRSKNLTYDTVPGKAFTAEVQVELRLAWAALPGGLLLFSLIFLLSTVWRTSDADKVGIWKTSALAMLFNGIGDDIQATLGNKVRTGDARKRAKDMIVQLDDE